MNDNKIDYSPGSIHKSRYCGEFMIIREMNYRDARHHRMYEIRFLLTNYITIVRRDHVADGIIKDPYFKNIYGVACVGIPDAPAKEYRKDYCRWVDIISRCYNKNNVEYYAYGGAGVSVCEKWLCFENFYRDIKFLPGYSDYLKNRSKYQLDKDYLQQGIPKCKHVYSPETCCFITQRMNAFYMHNNTCGYYGVQYLSSIDKYEASIRHNNHHFTIGIYNTAEFAASAYNYFISVHYPYARYNNVPTFSMEQTYEYDIRRNKHVNMCKIVDNPHPYTLCPQFVSDLQSQIAAKELSPKQILAPAIQHFII